jgi:chemotaxis protein CheD
VGVILYDPQARVGGLLHFLLPDSRLNPEKAADQPAMFGDTGIAMLLDEVFKRGATRKYLTVKLAGGAKSFGEASFFDIADRNVLMAKRLLWKNNLVPRAEETGGEESRTVRLFMADGRVTIKNKKGEHEL